MSHYDNEREAELNKEEWPRLMLGDCLERMEEIPDGSVDMILTDPPYGTTACKWDSIIPLEPMWEQLKRIIKPNGAIVMTASQPFTTTLIASNMKMFKYCWVWDKIKPYGVFGAKLKPLKRCEDIVVFSSGFTANGSKKNMPYYPQMTDAKTENVRPANKGSNNTDFVNGKRNKKVINKSDTNYNPEKRYPDGVIKISSYSKEVNSLNRVHPTQKPVSLMEYLIKTYTNESETVLDFTMGSGSTGVACKNLNRKFIGIEMDEGYFNIAKKRIGEAW